MDIKFYVPFETAKQLKEKGYPQEFADWYYRETADELAFVHNRYVSERVVTGKPTEFSVWYIAAPTYHEVVDWLEGKGIYITTFWGIGETDKKETYKIWWKGFIDIPLHEEQATAVYSTREEALNAAILKALEMI